jgi:hypothetical protein
MKAHIFPVVVIAAVLILGWSAWPQIRGWMIKEQVATPKQSGGYGQADVSFSEVTVTATIPLTAELQAQGLGSRPGLGDRDGMLWLYNQPDFYSFWMKNMMFPLDFIWINGNEVIDVTPNVKPPTSTNESELSVYRPKRPASAILEVAAGFADHFHIQAGDMVTIDRK